MASGFAILMVGIFLFTLFRDSRSVEQHITHVRDVSIKAKNTILLLRAENEELRERLRMHEEMRGGPYR
jgi:hypothetical protein